MITVLIPNLRLTNPLNNSQGTTRGAAMAAARNRKAMRESAKWHTKVAVTNVSANYQRTPCRKCCGHHVRRIEDTRPLVCGVRIVRIAPRPLDTDNLAAAAKACRDGVADALGIGDAQQGDFWRYAAESQGKGVYAVRIELMEVGDV